jgi:hypothetical protein
MPDGVQYHAMRAGAAYADWLRSELANRRRKFRFVDALTLQPVLTVAI